MISVRTSSLTVAQVLSWADTHQGQTAQWPTAASGAVTDGPDGLTWRRINNALRFGLRGLPGGSSLAQLLAEQRAVNNPRARRRSRRRNAERRQQAVALRLQGLAYREIAERLGVSKQAVHQWLHSGDEDIRAMEGNGHGAEDGAIPLYAPKKNGTQGPRLALPANSVLGKEETLAFLFGINATVEALGVEPSGDTLIRVLNFVKEVAEGKLTLRPTAAELRIRADEPAGDVAADCAADQARLAKMVWQVLAGCLFGGRH